MTKKPKTLQDLVKKVKIIEDAGQIVGVDLSNNDDDDLDNTLILIAANFLNEYKGLKYLDLSANNLGSDAVSKFLDALNPEILLNELNLRKTQIHPRVVKKLINFFQTNPQLTSLSLGANNLHDQGISEIAIALANDQHIEKVAFDATGITDKSVEKIADALKVNTHLAEVDLSYNSAISNKSAAVLCQALETNKSLTHLNLRCTSIGDSGAQEFITLLRERKNTTLRSLILPCNISNEKLLTIQGLLEQNITLSTGNKSAPNSPSNTKTNKILKA
jgi:Ran GTPase-activating protein (RanGAP) involved in mRNA processing and transport